MQVILKMKFGKVQILGQIISCKEIIFLLEIKNNFLLLNFCMVPVCLNSYDNGGSNKPVKTGKCHYKECQTFKYPKKTWAKEVNKG